MIDIEQYLLGLTEQLKKQFGSRLVYVGLQGSYSRGEATENSDLDVMTVIDGLTPADLTAYRAVLQSAEHYDKSCGFICSREDLLGWNPLEICHLIHTTKDYFGVLNGLVPAFSRQDVRNFVKISINNLYHAICHRWIHAGADRSAKALPDAYKGTFFILQNLYYLTDGKFVATKAELLKVLDGKNRAVLERAAELSKGKVYDFEESFELLFTWCQETLKALNRETEQA